MASFCRFLLLSVAFCPWADANTGHIMRRQDEQPSSEVRVASADKVEIHEHRSIQVQGDGALAQAGEAGPNHHAGTPVNTLKMGKESKAVTHKASKDANKYHVVDIANFQDNREVTVCDRDFHMNSVDGSDECAIGAMSWSRDDCERAADHLGYNMSANYTLNTHEQNPLPYPKGCFLNTTEDPPLIYFNPSESDTTGVKLMGKKICMRRLYTNGTAQTDADAACTAAGEGYVPILEYDACWYAMTCHKGGGAPKLDEFARNVTPAEYQPENKPKGCFMEVSTGKWGFNWIHKLGGTPDESVMDDCQSVCYDSTANSEAAAPAGGDAAAADAAF